MEKHHDFENESLLPEHSQPEDGFHYAPPFVPFKSRSRMYWNLALGFLILFPWSIVLFLQPWNYTDYAQEYKTSDGRPLNMLYSPVAEILEYQTTSFVGGYPEYPSEFSAEPSDELDELWHSLYPNAFQAIPLEQAARLPRNSSIIPGDPERRYAVELSVMHDLHCLNIVRQATRPDYYDRGDVHDNENVIGYPHVAHCIDIIRQSLMCASDVSFYTWAWEEGKGGIHIQMGNPHTCRNFDVVRHWAANHGAEPFNNSVRVMNDPLNPDTWMDGYHGE